MKKQEIEKLLNKKNKPLAGNNRSFSMRATRRKFATNRQKFQIGSKTYYIPNKSFRTYWANLKRTLER
jgi:ribosomal protein L28